MNMPGFTAEEGLRQHQHGGDYLLRSTDWPVGGAGDVRPQAIVGVCLALSRILLHCCVTNTNERCCTLFHRCEEIVSGG